MPGIIDPKHHQHRPGEGFTLYATCNVVSFRGDKLIDLAATTVGRHLLDAGSRGSNG
jgi:hypothetical protein